MEFLRIELRLDELLHFPVMHFTIIDEGTRAVFLLPVNFVIVLLAIELCAV
jgi:hypothetical protein